MGSLTLCFAGATLKIMLDAKKENQAAEAKHMKKKADASDAAQKKWAD